MGWRSLSAVRDARRSPIEPGALHLRGPSSSFPSLGCASRGTGLDGLGRRLGLADVGAHPGGHRLPVDALGFEVACGALAPLGAVVQGAPVLPCPVRRRSALLGLGGRACPLLGVRLVLGRCPGLLGTLVLLVGLREEPLCLGLLGRGASPFCIPARAVALGAIQFEPDALAYRLPETHSWAC